MFVAVLFGDSRMELFNLNCKLMNFIRSLKERCDLDMQDCVDLMDRTGTLMNLLEKEHSAELASSLLTERHSYVLIRICSDDNEGHNKYVSLLNNLNKNHPELADILRKMSNPSKDRDRRSSSLRKGYPVAATQSRGKKYVNKKSHQIK